MREDFFSKIFKTCCSLYYCIKRLVMIGWSNNFIIRLLVILNVQNFLLIIKNVIRDKLLKTSYFN